MSDEPSLANNKLPKSEPFLYSYFSNPKQPLVQPLDVFAPCLLRPFHDEPALSYSSSVLVGGSIFLTGGLDESEKASARVVEVRLTCFDKLPPAGSAKECKYTVRASMGTTRFFHGSALLVGEKRILVVAGLTVGEKATAQCELFSIGENSWRPVRSLPVALGFVAVASSTPEQAYVFGGARTDLPASSAIFRYDLAPDTWAEVTLAENQGWDGSASSILARADDSRLILFGGTRKSGGVMLDSYIYDTAKMTLRKAARIAVEVKAEWAGCVTEYEGKVFAVQKESCVVYDVEANRWSVTQFSSESASRPEK